MLNDNEILFIKYWEHKRSREKRFVVQLITGIPVGLLFALPIMFILFTSKYWFKRADMVANSQMNLGVILIAVLFIACFVGVLYKRHQWEQKDQQYRQLKIREQQEILSSR